jgi:hypothetical protein
MSITSVADAAPAPAALSTTAIAFYSTVALLIPVLFLALAVQGNASEGIFGALRGFWRLNFRSIRRTVSRDIASGRPTRAIKVIGWGSLSGLAGGLMMSGAILIIFAGGFGELLAVYILYQGHDQSSTRIIVLLATMILIIAITVGAGVTFARTFLKTAEQIANDAQKELDDAIQKAQQQGTPPPPATPGPAHPPNPDPPPETATTGPA